MHRRFLITVIPVSCLTVYLIVSATAYAQETIWFSSKSEAEAVGGDPATGVLFESALEADGTFLVKLEVNRKVFILVIPFGERVIIRGFFVNDESPARLGREDVTILTSFYESLQLHLDHEVLVDAKLSRFVTYLIDFHPAYAYVDLPPRRGTLELPTPEIITPVCDSIGETIPAEYDINWIQWLGIRQLRPWRCGEGADVEPGPNGVPLTPRTGSSPPRVQISQTIL